MAAYPVVTLHLNALTRQRFTLDHAVDALNDAVALNLTPEVQQRADATLNAEPGAHRRPTDWQTPRQRRWWFAVGIHQWQGRTGAVRRWRILLVRNASGGALVAINPTRHWPFVYGTRTMLQQRMHMLTWTPLTTYLDAEQAVLTPALIQTFAQLGATP